MVDFRQAKLVKSPRDYTSRKEQYRWLIIIFAVLGSFLMVIESLTQNGMFFRIRGSSSSAATDRDTKPAQSIDRPPLLPPGVFRAPLTQPNPDARSSVGSAPAVAVPQGAEIEIDFQGIEDDTVFQSSEAPAWYELLSWLKSADRQQIHEQSRGVATFEQLYDRPDFYRGCIVELNGTVRRAHYLKPPANDYGIDGYWQCWLYTDQSSNPVVVYSLNAPAEFPSGMKIQERANVTGVFFKRWAYVSASGPRRAPLIVAERIVWQPTVVDRPVALPTFAQVIFAIAFSAVLAVGTCRFVVKITSNGPGSRPLHANLPPDDVSAIAIAAGPSIDEATTEFLRELDRQSAKTSHSQANILECESDRTAMRS